MRRRQRDSWIRGRKGSTSSQLPHISTSHQSQVTRPISFGMWRPSELKGIADTFHRLCSLLRRMRCLLIQVRKSAGLGGKKKPAGAIWQRPKLDSCWNYFTSFLRWEHSDELYDGFRPSGAEAGVRGHQTQVHPSWHSNVQPVVTAPVLPWLLKGPALVKKQHKEPSNKTCMATHHL